MFCLGRRPFQGLILSGCHCPQNSPGLGISRYRLQVAALQESRAPTGVSNSTKAPRENKADAIPGTSILGAMADDEKW